MKRPTRDAIARTFEVATTHGWPCSGAVLGWALTYSAFLAIYRNIDAMNIPEADISRAIMSFLGGVLGALAGGMCGIVQSRRQSACPPGA